MQRFKTIGVTLGMIVFMIFTGNASAKSKEFGHATLEPAKTATAKGTVGFAKDGNDIVITAKVDGVTPGKHGIHVHQFGSCVNDFTSAGEHFNPTKAEHGDADPTKHHLGDLGNIDVSKEGKGELTVKFAAANYTNWNEYIGKAIVLHASEDDLKTQPSGASGARIACGVIKATSPTLGH